MLLAFSAAAPAQNQAPAASQPPAFDVASIRLYQNREGGGRGPRMMPFGRAAVQSTPDSIIARGATLKEVIAWAYDAKIFQVSGPDWLDTERFEIMAKAAGSSSEDRLRLMTQTLLADRFKLALHRSTKEMQAFVLVIGKGGSKLVPSQTEGESSMDADQKRMALTFLRTPLSQLTDILYMILRTPIVDETGLTGKYDLNVNVGKYVGMAGDGAVDPIGLIQTALQDEMGLKLESRKVTLDMLVVDHVEKTAGEN